MTPSHHQVMHHCVGVQLKNLTLGFRRITSCRMLPMCIFLFTKVLFWSPSIAHCNIVYNFWDIWGCVASMYKVFPVCLRSVFIYLYLVYQIHLFTNEINQYKLSRLYLTFSTLHRGKNSSTKTLGQSFTKGHHQDYCWNITPPH